jgi:hypothetical protein
MEREKKRERERERKRERDSERERERERERDRGQFAGRPCDYLPACAKKRVFEEIAHSCGPKVPLSLGRIV